MLLQKNHNNYKCVLKLEKYYKDKAMNYDNWKQETPPQEQENDCAFCGEPTENTYCSRECKKAYEQEN